jgi:hypothetical protein
LLDDAQPSREPSLLTGRAAPLYLTNTSHRMTKQFCLISFRLNGPRHFYCAYSSSSLSFRTRRPLLLPAARPLPYCISCTEIFVPVRACRAKLLRHEQPPRAFLTFPDAMSPVCVSRSRPADSARASLALSWNKHPFAHFSPSAGRAI